MPDKPIRANDDTDPPDAEEMDAFMAAIKSSPQPSYEGVKTLVRSHASGDDVLFYSVALQIAAQAARKGNPTAALELRDVVDRAKTGAPRTTHGVRPVATVRPKRMTDYDRSAAAHAEVVGIVTRHHKQALNEIEQAIWHPRP